MESVTVKRRSKSGSSCVRNHQSPHVCAKSGLSVLSNDHLAKPNARRTRCSRTIILQKSKTGSYGFTLQTYAFKNYKTNRAELLTYVDFVEVGGPAFRAGMKRGDVILYINDRSIDHLKHEHLVDFIRNSPNPMRLIVTFEDWCKRIDLSVKKLKLKQRLKEKYLELASLEKEERELLQRFGLWVDTDPSNVCSSDLSSEQPSPLCSKRDSFMSNSLNVLDAESLSNSSGSTHECDLARKYSNLLRARKADKLPVKSYECHSLPIVRKKKHSLQNQVFSVCENVVRMGCFSKSSVNIDGSIDDVALVGEDDLSSDCECGNARGRAVASGRRDAREQSKVWYGVPKMYRAALLKRQRKTGEGAKWYFSVFDDEPVSPNVRVPPSERHSDPTESDLGSQRSDALSPLASSSRHMFCTSARAGDSKFEQILSVAYAGSTTNESRPGGRLPGSEDRIRSSSDSNVGKSLSSYSGAYGELNSVSQEFLGSLQVQDANVDRISDLCADSNCSREVDSSRVYVDACSSNVNESFGGQEMTVRGNDCNTRL